MGTVKPLGAFCQRSRCSGSVQAPKTRSREAFRVRAMVISSSGDSTVAFLAFMICSPFPSLIDSFLFPTVSQCYKPTSRYLYYSKKLWFQAVQIPTNGFSSLHHQLTVARALPCSPYPHL